MSIELQNSELLKLFEAVLTERAVGEQFRELETLLDEDPHVRETFALYSQLHVDLRHAFRTGSIEMEKLFESPQLATMVPARSQSRWPLVDRSHWLVIAVAAALVLAVCLPLLWRSGEGQVATKSSMLPATHVTKPPEPVATLTGQSDAIWDGPSFIEGQTIRQGDELCLQSGEARVSVGVGAEFVAKGPCAVSFVARDRVQLDFGEVSVYVAEWAKGFTVVTSSMEVKDLGTTFTVTASRDAGAEASVLKGQVRVSPRMSTEEGPRSVLVSEGEALMVDRQGRRTSRALMPEDEAEIVDLSELQPYRPVALYNTGYRFSVGDEDPNWRVIDGPEGFGGPQFAMVCVPDVRYLPNDPSSSQWVSMANWRGAKANSIYTFQTSFDLTGYDLRTIQLFGRFLADNGIQAVRVNGAPVEVESWVDNVAGQVFGQPQFRCVNVTKGLVQGTNIVEIDVWNGVFQGGSVYESTPNPMALRVEWYAFGRQLDVAAEVSKGRHPSGESSFLPRIPRIDPSTAGQSAGFPAANRFVSNLSVEKLDF